MDAANGNSSSMILELRDVSVHYRAVVALDAVSLGARRGELVAVMGPNGAGEVYGVEGDYGAGAGGWGDGVSSGRAVGGAYA